VQKEKEKKKEAKKKEKEEEESEGMADSDIEDGKGNQGEEDDLRAWGSRKKHFYGGERIDSVPVLYSVYR
jgi:hypothetical protein